MHPLKKGSLVRSFSMEIKTLGKNNIQSITRLFLNKIKASSELMGKMLIFFFSLNCETIK